MRSITLVLFFGLSTLSFLNSASAFDHSHQKWTQLLKKRVRVLGPESKVDYSGVKNQIHELESYLQTLQSVKHEEFKAWSENQQMAFLINAYNAFTMKWVTASYPIESIKELGKGIFGLFPLVGLFKQDLYPLFGEVRSLHWIEHEVLRKDYNEPRIHFALNCASIGCPALMDEAYDSEKLDRQLERNATTFLQDQTRNYYDSQKKELGLSLIFDWFEEDFEKKYGAVQAFVAPRITSDPKAQEAIRKGDIDISYTDYNWDLNDDPKTRPKK